MSFVCLFVSLLFFFFSFMMITIAIVCVHILRVLIDDPAFIIMFTRRLDIVLIELVAEYSLYSFILSCACSPRRGFTCHQWYTNELCALSFKSAWLFARETQKKRCESSSISVRRRKSEKQKSNDKSNETDQ